MTKNSKESESIYHIVQREWKQEKELRPNRDKYSFLKKLITELLKKTNYREKIEEMDITQFKYLHDSKTDKYHPYSEFGQTQDSKRASPIFKRTSEIKGLDVEYIIPDERGIAELYVTLMKAEDRGNDVKELEELTDLLKTVRHGFPKNNRRIVGRPPGKRNSSTIKRYNWIRDKYYLLKKKNIAHTYDEYARLIRSELIEKSPEAFDGAQYSLSTIVDIIKKQKWGD